MSRAGTGTSTAWNLWVWRSKRRAVSPLTIRARRAVLVGDGGEELPLELVEAVRSAGEKARAVGDELLDRPFAHVAHPVPSLPAALEEPLLGGGEDPPLVHGEVEDGRQGNEIA